MTSHTGGAVDGVTSHSTDPLISLLGPWFNDTSRVTKDNMDVFIDDSIPKVHERTHTHMHTHGAHTHGAHTHTHTLQFSDNKARV